MAHNRPLSVLNDQIVACDRCPRLRRHCRQVAKTKRAAYRDWNYHGKPVPNFDSSSAETPILLVGLAPGAHGANRTGRMFTGDRSGDFLYRALFEAGLANQPTSTQVGDGLKLRGVVVTAACHCAPPGNKPLPVELANCAPWLERTFDLVRPRVVVCLGRIALQAVLKLYQRRGWIDRVSRYRFAHGAEHALAGGPTILCSYHPSQQNTFTGRLTPGMLRAAMRRAKDLAKP